MRSHSIFDDFTAASRELQRARIGDPAQSRRAPDEVSPLKRAADVRVPLLTPHGEEDARALPSQTKGMVKALKALGLPVECIPFEREEHGFFWVSD